MDYVFFDIFKDRVDPIDMSHKHADENRKWNGHASEGVVEMNLVEALQNANNRSREFIQECEDAKQLVSNVGGLDISIAVTGALIVATEKAIASGDVSQMVKAADAHGPFGYHHTIGGDDAK